MSERKSQTPARKPGHARKARVTPRKVRPTADPAGAIAVSTPRFEVLERRLLLSADPLSILAFGDSNTYGWASPDHSYRKYLGDQLDAAGVDYDFVGQLRDGGGFDADHYGVPGAKARDSYTHPSAGYIPSLRDSLRDDLVLDAEDQPDVVLLHIGTNSLRDGSWTVGAAIDELRALLNEMAGYWRDGRFASDVKIFLGELIPGARGDDGDLSGDRLMNTYDYNQQLTGLVNSLSDQVFAERIELVDFFAIRLPDLSLSDDDLARVNTDNDAYVDWFNGLDESNPTANITGANTEVTANHDYLHPTALGYRVMGQVWFNALDNAGLLEENPTPGLPGAGYTLAVTGDFDGDGDDDALWRNLDSGDSVIELYDGEIPVSQHGVISVSDAWSVEDAADYNGDGTADLLWLSDAGRVAFWFMDGASVDLQFPDPQYIDPAWTFESSGDMDSDGDLDIVWETGEAPVIWMLEGTTALAVQTVTEEPPAPSSPGEGYAVVAEGDFNGDGQQDRFWRNAQTGHYLLWLMEGGALIHEVDTPNPPGYWAVRDAGDYDGDGRDELLWINTSRRVAFWYFSDDATQVTTRFADPQQYADRGTTFMSGGDINGDGYHDIVWNRRSGPIAWLMRGNLRLDTRAITATPVAEPTTPGEGYSLVASADFDGDGDDDRFFRNASAGKNTLWTYENGSRVAEDALRDVNDGWTLEDVADYNGDGTADVLWVNRAGRVALWYMDGPGVDLRFTEPQYTDPGWSFHDSFDADGDGDRDIVWDTGADTRMWLLDGVAVTAVI